MKNAAIININVSLKSKCSKNRRVTKSRLVPFIIYLFSLFFLNIAHASTHHHAGATLGQFEVSPDGAATYTVPIEVPPNINVSVWAINRMSDVNGNYSDFSIVKKSNIITISLAKNNLRTSIDIPLSYRAPKGGCISWRCRR